MRGGDDPRTPLALTFLGTGNFHAPGRWSEAIDASITSLAVMGRSPFMRC